ncbi:protein transport protein Sec16B isoform X3 [Eulemur rufifrons]|uniref:protein transport protein Sec16B isoform X3 n=1 Tax=Eulemur rufifrons TaxID=859984 RepID=UPI0037448C93
MEFWAPQRLPQPWGRPIAPEKGPDQGLQRDGHHRTGPHSQHSRDEFHQWQDVHGSPQPQQDPRADHQQPHSASRPGEWHQPMSGVDYYEGGYLSQLYSRPGYTDQYQSCHSPVLREEYTYGKYYHHGFPQWLQEERVPRQGSPYVWYEGYQDQNYLNEHRHENQNSLFGTQNETQFQWNSLWPGAPAPHRLACALTALSFCCSPHRGNPRSDSPAPNSAQERARELLPERLLPGAQKNKPPLTGESSLLRQHKSGLSSSSYELSQYMADAEQYDSMASAAWSPVQAEDVSAARPKAPMKFYVPHVPVSFGPGGQLVCVVPSSPTDGQTALVDLHSVEIILNDSEEQEEMRIFSGPLIREDVHKVDIMMFCQQKAARSRKSDSLGSRDSALLWQLLVLLCRQNGSMVGSDIAELLMQDCRTLEKYKRQPPVANLINLTDEDWPVLRSGTRNLLTGEIPPSVETPVQIVEKFTKLLYYGRKKEALEWAMKNHLWGHALFLASKMDPRTYSWVMSGFTSTLALNDPLQTLFQLMSGRIPQAATCCGDKQWGDWRPHLAVILSNQTGDAELHQRTIVTMGDTLAGKGLVEAAHFCYLTAHRPFGYYTVKTDHLVLLGSSHSQEFWKFATTEAMQRTEIFEYCQMLGHPKSFIPSFQVYKLLYASRLADYGLVSQALHYCEAIGVAILSQGESSHPVLLVELIKLMAGFDHVCTPGRDKQRPDTTQRRLLWTGGGGVGGLEAMCVLLKKSILASAFLLAEKLKLSDPLVVERRGGDGGLEPAWLVQLRRLQEGLEQKLTGDLVDPHSARSGISGARGTATENTFYQDLSGPQGYSEAPGHRSALWPTPEQSCVTQPSPQQPLPLQPGSYPARGGAGQTGAPVPLYAVPETHLQGTDGSVAVTWVPGGTVWEETLQTHPAPGENTVSQETFQHPDGQKAISKPQAPLVPRVRSVSESSTISVKEDEESSSDEADKKSSQNTAWREKLGDGKESTKSSGFGWFSWFRSKPANNVPPSGDEDSSDSPDSEETPRASSAPQASLGLSLTPSSESPPLPGASAFSRGRGGGEGGESASGGGTAVGIEIGGSSEGVSPELFPSPGVLLPPPPFKGAVPLYNPSQVPQMPMATSQSRQNRLAQHRYPTQPC